MAFSKGSCTRVPMANSGYRAAASSLVQLCSLSFVRALRFLASWRPRAFGRPCRGGAPWGCFTGAWLSANTACPQVAGTSGLDKGDGVLQLEQLLGHEAKRLLGRLQGVGRGCGPGEKPVPGACPGAAHVGRVAGGVVCPRGGAFRGEEASWRPLCPVDGVVRRFPGCFWGLGDPGGESQAVSTAWRGQDLVVRGVRRCPSDLAVVVPVQCPPDVAVLWGCVLLW